MERGFTVSAFIMGKGYMCMGFKSTGAGSAFYKDCWEYDTNTDSWTQKADYPGSSGTRTMGFNDSTSMYVFSGYDSTAATTNFLYQFNVAGNTWTLKNTPPFTTRRFATTFTIKNKGYITGGIDTLLNNLTDLWMYNAATDTWTQKANCLTSLTLTHTVAAGDYGWIVRTAIDSLIEYNSVSDTWSYKRPLQFTNFTALYPDTNSFYGVKNNLQVMRYDIASDTFIAVSPSPLYQRGRGIIMNQHAYVGMNVYNIANDT